LASLAIALLLGLLAVVLVRGVLSSQRPGSNTGTFATQIIAVAAAPIDRGMALKPSMIKLVRYPADAVPAGAFQSVDQLFAKNRPEPIAQREMGVNEPILASKLNGAGSKATLAAVIQPGMRAVSLRSSDVAGVGGFVLPGDHVDILMTRTIGSGDTANSVTQALAENALVLGVDQTSDQGADKPIVAKAVTVQVTPDQAQAISLAESVGQLSLALRQSTDNGPLGKRATTVADFGFGHPVGSPAVKRIAKTPSRKPSGMTEVRVVRGVDATPYSVGAY
jgi:pilus assembly protein CpaB